MAAAKTFRSELARPAHVDAGFARPGIVRKQRAATRDQAIHIGRPGTADDDLRLSILDTA